jgi:hypothetical protein
VQRPPEDHQDEAEEAQGQTSQVQKARADERPQGVQGGYWPERLYVSVHDAVKHDVTPGREQGRGKKEGEKAIDSPSAKAGIGVPPQRDAEES